MDSCGLVVDSGPHPKITFLRQDDSKTFILLWTRLGRVHTEFTIDILRFVDSHRLGFYKIKKESTREDGLKAITNIVLGTRHPNGFYTKTSLVNLARTFITPLGDFQTPFLKEADRSDSTSVHQYIPRMLAASNVKHGSMATKFQAVFSMMLFRTRFAAFTLGGLIS